MVQHAYVSRKETHSFESPADVGWGLFCSELQGILMTIVIQAPTTKWLGGKLGLLESS